MVTVIESVMTVCTVREKKRKEERQRGGKKEETDRERERDRTNVARWMERQRQSEGDC